MPLHRILPRDCRTKIPVLLSLIPRSLMASTIWELCLMSALPASSPLLPFLPYFSANFMRAFMALAVLPLLNIWLTFAPTAIENSLLPCHVLRELAGVLHRCYQNYERAATCTQLQGQEIWILKLSR